jgi:hypothetical protein
MGVDIVAYGYAALVASGGIMGYAKAGKFYLLTYNYRFYKLLCN